MRRTTLGPEAPMSSSSRGSDGNSRRSLGPTRVLNSRQSLSSQPSKRISTSTGNQHAFGGSTRRLSTAPNAPSAQNRRQSSIGQRGRLSTASQRLSIRGSRNSRGSSVGINTDHRPLTDRTYISECVDRLVEFVSTHGFEESLPPARELKRAPQRKDFENLFEFLMQKLDPSFVLKRKERLETIVPNALRKVDFPYSISKTALVAVGSPHSWPSLLGMLVWLMDEVVMEEKTEEATIVDDDDDEGMDDEDKENEQETEGDGRAAFVMYIGERYLKFLSGDDEECSKLDAQEQKRLVDEKAEKEGFVDEWADMERHLDDEINDLYEQENAIPALESKKEDCESDLAKFRSMVKQFEEHKVVIQRKIETREKDAAKFDEQYSQRQERITQLKEQIAQQELSSEEVVRMTQEKQHMTEQTTRLQARAKELIDEQWQKDTERNQIIDSLEQKATEYHSKATELKLIPSTAKNAQGADLSTHTNIRSGGVQGAEQLRSHLKHHIRPAVSTFKTGRDDRRNVAADELFNSQQELSTARENLSTAEETKKAQEEERNKLEDQYSSQRDEGEQEETRMKQEEEKVKEEVSKMLNDKELERERKEKEVQLQRSGVLNEKRRQRHEMKREEMRRWVEQAVVESVRDKQRLEKLVRGSLTELANIWGDKWTS